MSLEAGQLLQPAGPHLHFAEADSLRRILDDVGHAGGIPLVGSLRHVRTPARLFDELARTLELPSYFGHNWDALDECLRDLPAGNDDQGCVLALFDAFPFWRESTVLASQFVECWLSAAADCAPHGAGLHLVFGW